ncbi:LANO_0G09648g1_1 [Lachancea nothofagi CBS 11611]|uniref:Dolichyl-phosphate-mannose--protein mannosyltransferase n=1 Tax=Lachancea nothofagi CBS 11611 TaxID=1266666 RepID=A0A1G4KIF7_9SACH|nr:LANO_0G09648g1_1 [Lachancea nothofagi CBS 11611]
MPSEAKRGDQRLECQDPVPDLNIGKGPVRPYVITEPPRALSESRTPSSMKEKLLIAALLLITGVVRLHSLSNPDSVVFDEVHFGGFASKYIKGIFFMDVHPPLAKMLFAAVGSIAGFNGDFEFSKIGERFPESTPYFFMRLFPSILGVLTVLLMYLTLRCSGVRIPIAFIASLCFAVENSYVTISRYILLDAPLLFFIASAAYAFKKYEIYPQGSWASQKALLSAGLALGMAVSSKWVGLFTIAWIGLLCIWRLWFMIGDMSKPVGKTVVEASRKLVYLLIVPAILYMTFFYIHFDALTISSDGAGFFSSAFRTTLQGNTIPKDILADVGIGSVVTIRHIATMGGYLHSHDHMLEKGSQQQQITLYPHLDGNNDWIIELNEKPNAPLTSFEGLMDGTIIKLKHLGTQRRLHSHDHKAPVSESADWQKEVSGYGFDGFEGDANDDWVVEIDQDASEPGEAQKRVKALDTKFRLRHTIMNCHLFSHEVKLPKWGFEQQEVTCASQGKEHLTLWYVEANYHPQLPEDAERVSYKKPGFFEKLIESHQRMWHINKNLVEPHIYESKPHSWPFLLRGINYWGENHKQVYLLGNAVVWWSVTAFIGIFALVVSSELISWQLGYEVLQDPKVVNFHVQVIHYLLGYALHYVPSFLMGRQLFLHHYMASYYFGILAFAHALEIIVTYVFRKREVYGYAVAGAFLSCTVYFFISYRPLIYGSPWTQELCEKSKWLSGWDYPCHNFLSSYDDYKKIETEQAQEALYPSQTLVAGADAKPTDNQNAPVAEPASDEEFDVDKIMASPGLKKFVDQNGNELPFDVVKDVLGNGGSVMSVEHRSHTDIL